MKKLKNIIAVISALSIIICIFTGCSSDSGRIDFIYPFKGSVKSFDPQISSESDEFLIIENCFEGLVRVNDDGSVQEGVAKSWSISKDGRTYTFNLRKGAKWHIEEDGSIQELMGENFNPDITAHDFVFALRRAVEKNTASPLYSSISNIVNAPKIHSGKMKSKKLGVKAIDDYTLEIKLSSKDNGFLSILSTAVAMPCSEDFFNATKGRYGLGLKYSLFNGQFYVSSILESSYILKKNEQYVGDYPSKVTDITLKITDENSDISKNLENGYYDSAFITGKEYQQLKSKDISAIAYSDKMWAFILNKNNYIFSEKALRQAVCLSISQADLSSDSYLEKATGYTPPSCIIGNEAANKAIGKTVPDQNTEKAKELWKSGLERTGLTSAEITVITTEDMEAYSKQFVQGIQGSIGKITTYANGSKISFSLKIEVLSDIDFQTAVAKGNYDMALYSFTSSSHSPVNFLEEIYKYNISGTVNEIETALKKAQSAKASSLALACRNAEKAILNDYSIMPVLFESSYYAQAKGVSGVQFHPGSGRVSFVNADRKN